jgi:hypothetical protein
MGAVLAKILIASFDARSNDACPRLRECFQKLNIMEIGRSEFGSVSALPQATGWRRRSFTDSRRYRHYCARNVQAWMCTSRLSLSRSRRLSFWPPRCAACLPAARRRREIDRFLTPRLFAVALVRTDGAFLTATVLSRVPAILAVALVRSGISLLRGGGRSWRSGRLCRRQDRYAGDKAENDEGFTARHVLVPPQTGKRDNLTRGLHVRQ